MFFKNLRVFRLAPSFDFGTVLLDAALRRHEFRPGSAQEMQTLGWVQPCEHASTGLAHCIDGQYLIKLRVEKKLLPATVINQAARAKALDIEENQGYKPGRKLMKEIKEQVTDELLPKSHSLYRDTFVWIDTKNHWLVIDAAVAGKADEVLGLLAKAIDPFPVMQLYVEQSPAGAMTSWLLDDEAPASFTIDQDTELQSTSASGAKVRYVRQSMEMDDVRKHVQAGKQATRLAMTWSDRITFVLTEGLDIKRVTPLDVIKETQNSAAENAAEKFDSDFVLMTGELSRMLDALVDALGGEKQY